MKAKRGRKPSSQPWNQRWPKSLLDRARKHASRERRSVPSMLVILVEEALDAREGTNAEVGDGRPGGVSTRSAASHP